MKIFKPLMIAAAVATLGASSASFAADSSARTNAAASAEATQKSQSAGDSNSRNKTDPYAAAPRAPISGSVGANLSTDTDAATRAQKGAPSGDSGPLGAASSTGAGVHGSAQVGNSNATTGGSATGTTTYGK